MGGIFNLASTRILRRKENAEQRSGAVSEAK